MLLLKLPILCALDPSNVYFRKIDFGETKGSFFGRISSDYWKGPGSTVCPINWPSCESIIQISAVQANHLCFIVQLCSIEVCMGKIMTFAYIGCTTGKW